MSTGQNIRASDFNAIRTKVEQILDTGGTAGGVRGYGQPMISTPVSAEVDVITRAQWESLRRDIINIKIHQENPKDSFGNVIVPFVIPIPVDEPIRYGSSYPNTNFDDLINQSTLTSLQIAEGRSIVSSATGSPKIRTASWNNQVSSEVTVTFTGYTRPSDSSVISAVDHARYFFNSGGRIRISSDITGGTLSLQNNSWKSLLVQAGIKYLAATDPETVNFYSLTTSYQTLYEASSSSPYSLNVYKIEVKGDLFDALTNLPTQLIFKITWTDGYQDSNPAPPADIVDGTLSLTVEELKATGPIFNSIVGAGPTGSWYLPSPTYSITDILGS